MTAQHLTSTILKLHDKLSKMIVYTIDVVIMILFYKFMIARPLSAQTRVLTKFIFKILNTISDALSVCVLYKVFTKVIFNKLLVVTGCATHKPSDWCRFCLPGVFFVWLHVVYMVNVLVCFRLTHVSF